MKITVRKLGRIKKAEIELKPLTIFIGPNNTNKTWFTYMIYGIFDYGVLYAFSSELVRSNRYEKYFPETFMEKLGSKYNQTLDLQEIVKESLQELVNDLSRYFTRERLQTFMNADEAIFKQTSMRISFTDDELTRIANAVYKRADKFRYPQNNSLIRIEKEENSASMNIEFLEAKSKYPWGMIRRRVIFFILTFILDCIFNSLAVFPAERKALSYLSKYLSNPKFEEFSNFFDSFSEELNLSQEDRDRGMDMLFGFFEERTKYSYPKPIKDYIGFLEFLEDPDTTLRKPQSEHKPFQAIASLLDQEILGGRIDCVKVEGLPSGRTRYFAKEGIELDMSISSSMVKSLSAISLYMKRAAEIKDLLIIDEPEMNLHPEAVVKLTEIFAILVNSGINILLTTHSPYIVDHLTNLIAGADSKNKSVAAKKLFLGKSDAFIDTDKVAVYLFQDDGKIRSILDKKKRIIEWETFSNVSERVSKLYYEL